MKYRFDLASVLMIGALLLNGCSGSDPAVAKANEGVEGSNLSSPVPSPVPSVEAPAPTPSPLVSVADASEADQKAEIKDLGTFARKEFEHDLSEIQSEYMLMKNYGLSFEHTPDMSGKEGEPKLPIPQVKWNEEELIRAFLDTGSYQWRLGRVSNILSAFLQKYNEDRIYLRTDEGAIQVADLGPFLERLRLEQALITKTLASVEDVLRVDSTQHVPGLRDRLFPEAAALLERLYSSEAELSRVGVTLEVATSDLDEREPQWGKEYVVRIKFDGPLISEGKVYNELENFGWRVRAYIRTCHEIQKQVDGRPELADVAAEVSAKLKLIEKYMWYHGVPSLKERIYTQLRKAS